MFGAQTFVTETSLQSVCAIRVGQTKKQFEDTDQDNKKAKE